MTARTGMDAVALAGAEWTEFPAPNAARELLHVHYGRHLQPPVERCEDVRGALPGWAQCLLPSWARCPDRPPASPREPDRSGWWPTQRGRWRSSRRLGIPPHHGPFYPLVATYDSEYAHSPHGPGHSAGSSSSHTPSADGGRVDSAGNVRELL